LDSRDLHLNLPRMQPLGIPVAPSLNRDKARILFIDI
jgi:hypothetical protein